MPIPGFPQPPLNYAMLHDDTLSGEFRTILNFDNIFGDLIQGGDYTPAYINLDGINQYVNHNLNTNNLLGDGSNNKFTLAIAVGQWDSFGAPATQYLLDNGTNLFCSFRAADTQLRCKAIGATAIFNVDHNATVAQTTGIPYAIYVSVDYSSTTTYTFEVNGSTSVQEGTLTLGNGLFDFSNDPLSFGALLAGANYFDGCLGPVWFIPGVYDASGFTKFFNADNTPKDWTAEADVLALGAPTLHVPDFMDVDVNDNIVNVGSGANLALITGDPRVNSPTSGCD